METTRRGILTMSLAVLTAAGTRLTLASPAYAWPRFPPLPLPSRPSPADRLRQARQALEAFRTRPSPAHIWPRLSKTALVTEIAQRLDNPFWVHQQSEPLCGPASIVFELVQKRPERYVSFCQALFEQGGFQGVNAWVGAEADLRQRPNPGTMAQVDWMLMATMRDAENLFFDVDSDSAFEALAGMTLPGAMQGWARELLGCSAVEFTSTEVWGEQDALKEARDTVQRGGVAFLCINSLLLENRCSSWDFWPNHWVALRGNVSIQDGGWYWDWGPRYREGHYRFDVYSWGRTLTVDVGEGCFEDYFFGVVTGDL
jgi:hypothetical protein